MAFEGSPLQLHHEIGEEKKTLMRVLQNLMSFESLVIEPLHKFTKNMFIKIVSPGVDDEFDPQSCMHLMNMEYATLRVNKSKKVKNVVLN